MTNKFVIVDIHPDDYAYSNRSQYIGATVELGVDDIFENPKVEGYQSALVKFTPPLPKAHGGFVEKSFFLAIMLETLENVQAERTG